ncbi:hypothetical protein ACIG0C_14790 [Kitasatospora aureofaciens]|uniref:Glycosyltransferase RgtA/B/C/D-like domain-containing protein n=1 Tax=Kitasatospora aureofaciens TaxID=1894 RepID=A0A1E7NAJ8_KITAU|nr:hypothetical protein [Kitasatospora aureofaciens]ARF79921.1 hypothetical protein B6264_14310 [Kitasatospora aureofaciens]OEV37664.1 hypothetical protein HS99_0025520 [Kitasatospora aureofaciens]GGU91048.1 hypothetical protein GCM10010502_50330 [Kitasatospora aureofaciens]
MSTVHSSPDSGIQRPTVPPGPAGGRASRNPLVLAGGLALSWLVPTGLVTLHLGILLLPLLLVATASVIRVGGVLLDRLFVAALILFGGVLTLGLVFSLWPWGLSPVATTGTMFSVLTVAAWAARRAPRLPLRFRWSDLLVVGTFGGLWHYLYHPVAGATAAERVAFFATSEDRLSHFSFFSAIEGVGGFNFFHQDAAKAYLMPPSEVTYPQGSHFLLAWTDTLVHSAANPGDMLQTMNRYFLYLLVAYALFCTALVWAARWIGGPRLRGWRAAAVCATVGSIMFASNYMDLLVHGFDSTFIGLLLIALSLAVLVRPAMGRTEFVLAASAGLITVTFTYNIYGAFVGVALLGALVAHRRKFAGYWWWTLGALLCALGVAALPSVLSVMGNLDVASASNMNGPSVGADRSVLIGGGLLGLLAAAMPRSRRTATGQAHLAVLLGTGAVLSAFAAYQLHSIGRYSYYFHKMTAVGVVVALISVGAVGVMLQTPYRGTSRALPRRLGELALSGLAVAAALSMFANVQWGFLATKDNPSAWSGNPLVAWGRGEFESDMGPKGVEALAPLRGTGGPVIALVSNDDYKNLKATWLASLLNRRGGDMKALYEMHWVDIGGPQVKEEDYQRSFGRLKGAIDMLPAPHPPVTILTADRAVGDRIKRDLAKQGVKATVLSDPEMLWTQPWGRTFPGV